MSSGIYVIRNLVNDKLYVGKSVHIENRWLEHQSDLRNGRHANIHLQRAYDKYGPDNLLHEVLELCEEDVLDSREIYWINHFGGHESERLYNMTAGGEGFAGGHPAARAVFSFGIAGGTSSAFSTGLKKRLKFTFVEILTIVTMQT